MAAGVITSTGGLASHAAVLALGEPGDDQAVADRRLATAVFLQVLGLFAIKKITTVKV